MRKANYKGRCTKRKLSKCKDICRTYSDLQLTYSQLLEESEDIAEIRCNVPLEGLPEGDYTSDFVCRTTDGDLIVRECVERKHLTKPLTVKLLDASRNYWQNHGVIGKAWGIVTDAEK
ncbi:MAG: hypothetical protein LUG99_22805 [Lachnospiraceae bacterium]|nr:hypothetical protein [Lachnospiraceae bacterium]